jgi:uroporphyrinogen-III synthase
LPDSAATVLITRPQPAAEETARRVEALGLRPIVAPLLTIRRVPADLPGDAAAVLVTSSNAIESLPAWARSRPILAVGDATAARARAAGFPHVLSAGGNASDLAALVDRALPSELPGELLLLTGKGQGTALVGLLRDQQRQVVVREVYETAAVPELPGPAATALREGGLDVALFFSTDTAGAFVHLVNGAHLQAELPDTDAIAISRAAGMALEALPWRRVRVAARPTQDAMLALLR